MTAPKPLPCIVCGFQPESVDPHDGYRHVPSGATMFSAGNGHYGSTVWDEMSQFRSLVINVCDPCLRRRAHRVAVKVHTPPERPNIEFVPWHPEPDDEAYESWLDEGGHG